MSSTLATRPIHPFPARMASEIALRALSEVPAGGIVCDPMCGSGTVLREASNRGFFAIGRDIDPLAILIAKVWNTPVDANRLLNASNVVLADADSVRDNNCGGDWLDRDPETTKFVRYWFAQSQRAQLLKLAVVLQQRRGPIANALRLALSRTIITKSGGASLASDISHSRPHRTRETNEFDVFTGFAKSVRSIATSLERDPPSGSAIVRRGDATKLRWPGESSVDAIITSPPYGSGIDYLRGHKLALVWLGHTISSLRGIRSGSIGTQRGLEIGNEARRREIAEIAGAHELEGRALRILERFAVDMKKMFIRARRMLRPGGTLVVAIGDSTIGGIHVDNAAILADAAVSAGLTETNRYTRAIPADRRYMPPPHSSVGSAMSKRLSVETVSTFA